MAAAAEEKEEEEQEEEECPKCPPVGAPAWMATFADMATLLMAFFVLILSFAEFNVPKFKQISGSLKNAFGIQRLVPVVEQPKGTTVLSLNFSPSPSPSVSKEMTQQTTQVEQPELELKQKDKDSEGADGKQSAEALVEALEEAVARGDIEIETDGEELVVTVKSESTAPSDDVSEILKETKEALSALMETAAGQPMDEEKLGGIENQLAQIEEYLAKSSGGADGEGGGQASADQEEKAEVSEDELRIALKEEIEQGLVEVERKDGKIFITVGAGGAFASGSAELTPKARDIMSQVADKGVGESGRVTVTGHTDNVPLVFGSSYRDNWDLAAARASSVVQAMQSSGVVSADRMQAVSLGEAQPIADNETEAGREKNRRIEIEIQF